MRFEISVGLFNMMELLWLNLRCRPPLYRIIILSAHSGNKNSLPHLLKMNSFWSGNCHQGTKKCALRFTTMSKARDLKKRPRSQSKAIRSSGSQQHCVYGKCSSNLKLISLAMPQIMPRANMLPSFDKSPNCKVAFAVVQVWAIHHHANNIASFQNITVL